MGLKAAQSALAELVRVLLLSYDPWYSEATAFVLCPL